jgi:hypothetical protein
VRGGSSGELYLSYWQIAVMKSNYASGFEAAGIFLSDSLGSMLAEPCLPFEGDR